ncbi:MAG: hypothetical protein WA862_00830 [Solirubrobacterales bacterium]
MAPACMGRRHERGSQATRREAIRQGRAPAQPRGASDLNIAARLADAAKPGEILVSDPAFEALDPADREPCFAQFMPQDHK